MINHEENLFENNSFWFVYALKIKLNIHNFLVFKNVYSFFRFAKISELRSLEEYKLKHLPIINRKENLF